MEPEEYLKKPYSRIIIPDEGGLYSGEILEFPGCFADGSSLEEVVQNLEEAALSWIMAAEDQGMQIPEPFESQSFGGKIALRLPKSLHKQSARLAELDGISLNQFLVDAIAEKVGAENFYRILIDHLSSEIGSTKTMITNVQNQFEECSSSATSDQTLTFNFYDLHQAKPFSRR